MAGGWGVNKFRSDLFDLKNKTTGIVLPISRILCLKIGQRWPEDEMYKWGSYFGLSP